ncbi:CHAT domain-containing protein [Suillus cothurnatus]|nr:CHAT domain-containing protein [Suillus cothurnatus]
MADDAEQRRAVLQKYSAGYSLQSQFLNNLTNRLRNRFSRRGVLADSDDVEQCQAALRTCCPGHSDLSESLNNLAASLGDRFLQRGVPSDLDDLGDRFLQWGVPSDLDEHIKLYREALFLRPPSHSARSHSLNNLAVSLWDRFLQRGIPSDLDECIKLHRDALLLHPPSHSLRSQSLNNLALSLRERFLQRGVPSDLDDLGDRFSQRGVPSDLDECIELLRDALLLLPPSHSHRSDALENLAISLGDRFSQWGVPSDLDESIELHRDALLLCPPGHSLQSSSLNNLANSLGDRFRQWGDLAAAKSWVTAAEETNHASALLAYQTALKFLDQHVTLLSSSSRNFDVIRMATASLAVDAFSCSIRHRTLTIAVDLVEQGRAVFSTQLACLSSLFDELSLPGDTGAVLVEEFKQLSSRLRAVFDRSTEDQSSKIRQLTIQWNDVLSRIHMFPDFSWFLLPPLFSDLQKAADEGPVIIVNASQFSCDALIVLRDQDPIIAQHLAPIVSPFTLLEDSDATVQGVLDALNHNQWLHLACHGMPNQQRPFKSSFTMHDGPLMIKDIIRSNWQNPEFAFLSACHTTMGDENSPDESIHLAAAMQFSGFHSVIGSMWSVNDDVARQVVSTFYDKLVDDSGRLDYR